VIGNMTAMFSAGQVLGPVGAGILTASTHSYRLSMLLSGLVLFLAVAILLLARNNDPHTVPLP
jgi:MFS family permease